MARGSSAVVVAGIVAVAAMGAPSPGYASQRQAAYPADGCSYATVSSEDQRRYRSRYERRVRTQGREAAEAWLRTWLCPSEEQAARRQQARAAGPVGADGRPCRRTRTEMRAVSSGGSMTMIPVAVCAD